MPDVEKDEQLVVRESLSTNYCVWLFFLYPHENETERAPVCKRCVKSESVVQD